MPRRKTHYPGTIIGVCGLARSGKDEIAKILVCDADFKKCACADALKQVLAIIKGVPVSEFYEDGVKETHRLDMQQVSRKIKDHYGNDVWVQILTREICK